MRTYNGVIKNLRVLLNHKGRNGNGFNSQEQFLKLLTELKEDFNKEVSTTFLINLMSNKRTRTQKNQRIRNLTRGLERQKRNRYTRELQVVKFDKDIIEYKHKEGVIYNDFPEHLFNDFMEVEDFRNKKNDFRSNKDKLVLRNAINKGGGVCVGDVRTETILNEFMTTPRQTFNFISLWGYF